MVDQRQYQNYGTQIIKTNDGWMTFLIITLLLLTASFYSVYYLNLKAQFDVVTVDGESSAFPSFDSIFDGGDGDDTTDRTERTTERKDFATLLEEKRMAEAAEQEDNRLSDDAFSTEEFIDEGLVEDEEFIDDVLENGFFVVNHIFTYNSIFKSGEANNNQFSPGATAYLFVEMYNLQEDINGNISLSIHFTLRNEANQIIRGYDVEDLVVYVGKPPYKDGYFLARIVIPIDSSFTSGKYYTDLVIKDGVSGQVRPEKYMFRIKEPTL
ncbi:hypothetical protein C0585_07895 [Candidatus Woesearchaeota archaeon]|nr:MAG: hypothetical protein C0585_07895 [Candidatus Woesearchaeota archaeon]